MLSSGIVEFVLMFALLVLAELLGLVRVPGTFPNLGKQVSGEGRVNLAEADEQDCFRKLNVLSSWNGQIWKRSDCF